MYVERANRKIPVEYSSHDDYKDYIEIVGTFREMFDAVLIDGRARVACARYVRRFLKDGAVIFVHDFWKRNRSRYHVLLGEFVEVGRVDSTRQGNSLES